MSSLKVLTFGWELAPVLSGGLGVVCRELTDALAAKDVAVTFVVPKVPQAFIHQGFELINADRIAIDTDLIQKISISTPLLPYLDSGRSLQHCINSKFSYEQDLYGMNLLEEVECYALTAAKISATVPHDLIHAHDWMTGIAALKAKAVSKKPFVFHVHSTEYDRTANNPNPLIVAYERLALEGADRIIAISEYTKHVIVDKYGINPEKISIVHNAINSDDIEIRDKTEPELNKREKTVLFLARLTVQKGADYLLRAAQKVLLKKRNVKFIIVGKGPMLSKLIDLSFELGIAKNVIFAGSMPHEEVDHAYRNADLFVMPSVSEPFGLTCLEAIKNGTPVLISNQSGASEVIRNALKVDFWDVEAMASKILSVLEYVPLSATLSQNGYHDLQKLTWSGQADKVIEIYHELIREQQSK